MATASMGTHASGGSLGLMSCVRESSPHESISDYDNEKNVTSKKKFWNPRKWFKRKSNKVAEEIKPEATEPIIIREAIRSRSASELSETEEPVKRRSGTPMHPGLSVSHDSIFHSPNSGSELELEEAQSSSSLSIQHHPTQRELRLQTELSERLRSRRGHGDTSEDDEGLPRSPCCNSPTTMEGLHDKAPNKSHTTKSHSTCSDGSLLSMGSSEDIEEDSYLQHSSQHSSKVSLHEKKVSSEQDSDWELSAASVSTPLNHSAAHHRVSVRPKRTHGAPRRKRMQPVVTSSALPTTPEVNEDLSLRSSTPETTKKETVTELYSISETKTETQLKCSSLPPGLAGPTSESGKLNRSRSSGGSKSQDALYEEDEDKGDKKSDTSIFARFFPRRSGKKKRSVQEITAAAPCSILSHTQQTFESSTPKVESNPVVLIKSGPASRQRIIPLDIPASPGTTHKEKEMLIDKAVSAPQVESCETTAPSPKLSTSSLPKDDQSQQFTSTSAMVWSEFVSNSVQSTNEQVDTTEEKGSKYESKSRVKIAGLSFLQQRVLLHNEDQLDNTCMSLTDFGRTSNPITSLVTKSHSFRTSTRTTLLSKNDFIVDSKTDHSSISKSTSIDSIKMLDEPNDLSIISQSSESVSSDTSAKTSSTEFLDSLNPPNSTITISGPSHTSVVSVSSHSDATGMKLEPSICNTQKEPDEIKDQQVSITTIQLKREINPVPKSFPEFFNVQLNKVDSKTANVILTTPTKLGSETKNIFNFETPPKSPLRKFSQDDIEVVDKEIIEDIQPSKNSTAVNVIITSMTPPVSARIFKRNTEVTLQTRKSSLVLVTSESKSKLSLRTKSSSLDSDISQTNLDNPENKLRTTSTIDLKEDVIMRRKSLVKEKHDDEPELMKVFARRSLKVKDGDEIAQQVLNMIEDSNIITHDSDKENVIEDNNLITKELEKPKEQLVETKYTETTEVTLRKPVNNKVFAFQQRTVSLNVPKVNELNSADRIQKNVFNERPRTQMGSKINDLETKVVNLDISSKSDFINEDFPSIPKNFNQRKAEWEKRAQEALKKTVP